MKKVTIIVTETGYTITLELNGKTYTQKWEATSSGSTCVEDSFKELEEEYPELCYDITDGFTAYDIMKSLIYNC